MNIQEIVTARKISYLLHFTRTENLESILKYGLLPRGVCTERGIVPLVNDDYRLDETDAVCLSISFPNYMMFYKLRKKLEMTDPNSKWTVVLVKPTVMWEKSCIFCRENAASTSVTKIALEQRHSDAALELMFSDYNDKTRKLLGITSAEPTHPQAEVLVIEPIGPEYIIGAAFDKAKLSDEWNTKGITKAFLNVPHFFKSRSDHMHWKR